MILPDRGGLFCQAVRFSLNRHGLPRPNQFPEKRAANFALLAMPRHTPT